MFKKFIKCESGIAAIEFLLIACVMALVLIGVMPRIATSSTDNFSSLAGHISSGT